MPQIFHPSMNTISRVTIFGALFIVGAIGWVAYAVVRSPYVTNAGVIKQQPVPFSHKHHVSECGIDCRYCHTSVESSSFGGIPPTHTSRPCHSDFGVQTPTWDRVRPIFKKKKPMEWNRVHDLPDF